MRSVIVVLLVCAIFASPAACISRWFTATFNDLKFTLYRYGYCVNGLLPVTSARFNETEFLVSQIRNFLDQGNYDNEQLANVTSLMDTICRTSAEPSYPISVHVNITSFNSSTNPWAKHTRCHAIDDAMDSMYHVFKRAALDRQAPLDFSSIKFFPNETETSAYYNLSDLINTSWITSEVVLEHVCGITNATKEYVQERSRNMTIASRSDTQSRFSEVIDFFLEPLLGFQKRLYWESTNRLEFIQSRVSSGLSNVRNGIGRGLGATRDMLLWRRPNTMNSTSNMNSSSWANMNGSRPMNLTTTRPPRTFRPVDLQTPVNATTTAPSTSTTTRVVASNRTATSTTIVV